MGPWDHESVAAVYRESYFLLSYSKTRTLSPAADNWSATRRYVEMELVSGEQPSCGDSKSLGSTRV